MGRGGQLHEPGLAAPATFLARIQSDDDVSRDPEVYTQAPLRRQLRTVFTAPLVSVASLYR